MSAGGRGLLFEEEFGEQDPEAEETYESAAGDKSFHCLNPPGGLLMTGLMEGIVRGKCYKGMAAVLSLCELM